MPADDIPQTEAERFWEDRYRGGPATSSGTPGKLVQRFLESLSPGRALELGCARGDDAVWLAGLGWTVTAVDISATALDLAAANARRMGVEGRIAFQRYDLARTFPEGRFDLVLASFLQSPVSFPRAAVLARAAEAVTPGGHLFVVEHGSRAPWSEAPADTTFPTADETLASMALAGPAWQRLCVEGIERQGTGPKGQTARLLDNVVFLRRL